MTDDNLEKLMTAILMAGVLPSLLQQGFWDSILRGKETPAWNSYVRTIRTCRAVANDIATDVDFETEE